MKLDRRVDPPSDKAYSEGTVRCGGIFDRVVAVGDLCISADVLSRQNNGDCSYNLFILSAAGACMGISGRWRRISSHVRGLSYIILYAVPTSVMHDLYNTPRHIPLLLLLK